MSNLEKVREKLHRSMESNQKETILKLSQELDKLILDYIKKDKNDTFKSLTDISILNG